MEGWPFPKFLAWKMRKNVVRAGRLRGLKGVEECTEASLMRGLLWMHQPIYSYINDMCKLTALVKRFDPWAMTNNSEMLSLSEHFHQLRQAPIRNLASHNDPVQIVEECLFFFSSNY